MCFLYLLLGFSFMGSLIMLINGQFTAFVVTGILTLALAICIAVLEQGEETEDYE